VVPVLVKAVQDQQAIIQRQEARIASLEQRPLVSSMLSGGMNLAVALGAVGGLAFVAVRRRREQRQEGGPRAPN
jgi:predicted MFS family arabinose efflux permease